MRIAAAQMNSGPDIHSNLAQALGLVIEAASKDCDLIAFPENFLLFSSDGKDLIKNAHDDDSWLTQTLIEWAIEHQIHILAGSLPYKVKGSKTKTTNTSLLITPEGKIIGRYDKIHLFDVTLKKDQSYHESKWISPGKKPTIVKTEFCKMGMSVCYDLRFAELYRFYSKKGAEILFIPAAFTAYTGKAHWDVLTRARAIENQCFVIAPAQFGSPYPGRETHGFTRIIDPWGRVIAEKPKGVGIVWADLNAAELDQIRTELPSLNHRVLG